MHRHPALRYGAIDGKDRVAGVAGQDLRLLIHQLDLEIAVLFRRGHSRQSDRKGSRPESHHRVQLLSGTLPPVTLFSGQPSPGALNPHQPSDGIFAERTGRQR